MARHFARGNARDVWFVTEISWTSTGRDICISGKGTPRLADFLASVDAKMYLKKAYEHMNQLN